MKVLKTIFVLLLIFITPAIAEGTLELPSSLQTIKAEAFADTSAFTEIIVPSGTKTIESRAFANSNLKIIHLPDSLRSIADDAFEGCTNVTAIFRYSCAASNLCKELGIRTYFTSGESSQSDFSYTVQDGEACITDYKGSATGVSIPYRIDGYIVTSISKSAFGSNQQLTSVRFPPFLKTVDGGAFSGCSKLTSVGFNDGLLTIGSRAFASCTSLRQINLPDSLTSIGNSAFSDTPLYSVTIPNSVTELGNDAFKGTWLESVQLPEGLRIIGYGTFENCRSLSQINFPSSLTSIGDKAFYCCYKLKTVELPKGIESIGGSAFAHCDILSSINLPTTVTSIGDSAFYNCKKLTATVSEDSYAHTWCVKSNVPVNVLPGDYKYDTINGSAIITAYIGTDKKVTIPATMGGLPVTDIGAQAFKGNNTMEGIYFPATIRSIGNEAFSGCKKLKIIGNPPTVLDSIGSEAFAGCTSLTEITIPDSISEISSDAFKDCPNIGTIYATAGTNGATLISNLGFSFTDKRDKTLVFSQSADVSGELSLEIRKYSGNAEELDIPEAFHDTKITAIGSSAFSGNAKLTKVNLSEGLLSIGEHAFAESGVTRINFPVSLTSIASNAFESCGDLLIFARDGSYGGKWCASSGIAYYLDTTPNAGSDFTIKNLSSTTCAITGYTGERKVVAIPEKIDGRKVTTIAMRAFIDNTYIKEITIPSSVTMIEPYAFYDSAITKLVLNEGLKTIDFLAFARCDIVELQIPDSVTTIEDAAFDECIKLTKVKLSRNLKSINEDLFHYCYVLESITIPNGVKTIGRGAFYGSGLTTAYIPGTVTSIGEEAFYRRVTIHCPKDSYAAKWAAENGNKIVYE